MQQRNDFQFSVSNLPNNIEEYFADWNSKNVKRLFAKDKSLWTNTDEDQWMGWLELEKQMAEIPKYVAFAENAKKFRDIVLLGMGGSSLFPAMLAEVFPQQSGYPKFAILDSTDPEQIKSLESKINLHSTLFIVASKSGNTLETDFLRQYFQARLQQIGEPIGKHFVAITDANSALERLAKKEQYCGIFLGVNSIGGRYSALSPFGLLPMALMGLDLTAFLNLAAQMRDQCFNSLDVKNNPGVYLGLIIGICAQQGKDKLTLKLSPKIAAFGAWVEQLIAESTGKNNKGIIPILQEPSLSDYAADRVFICISDGDEDFAEYKNLAAGHPVIHIKVPTLMHLAVEVLRFEIATIVAASILQVNPFNQPDVEGTKRLTNVFLNAKDENHSLPLQKIQYENVLARFTSTTTNLSIDDVIKQFLHSIQEHDYFAITAFIAMNEKHVQLLQEIQNIIAKKKKIATTINFGPRFLHSTGQLFQGGPNTGVFLQFIANYDDNLALPESQHTFGQIIHAQAEGNFISLLRHDRRILQIRLHNITQGLQTIKNLLLKME